MPQVTWERLSKDPAVLHLIAGALPLSKAGVRSVRKRDTYREELMGRLVSALKPKGRWALTSVGDGEGSEVRVAFDKRGDAERVAVVIDAKSTGRYEEGWASQRRFLFDEAAEQKVAGILGAETA
jgi:hypothetical protein